MPLDELPGVIQTFTRDEHIARFKRDYRFASGLTEADTGDGTQVDIDGRAIADQLVVLDYDAVVAGNALNVDTSDGDALRTIMAAEGVEFQDAVGSSGYVTIDASVGGGTIFAGDDIKDVASSGLRFKCTATALYLAGAQVPVAAIDTGPGTNLDAGAVLSWTSTRPGIGPSATVTTQTDGSGLSGGRDAWTTQEARNAVKAARARRAASGNDAEVQEIVEKTPGISVQKAFTVPCTKGPGSTAFAFTLTRAKPGSSRIPNGAQIAAALAFLQYKLPADDSPFPVTLVSRPTDAIFMVSWKDTAIGWADVNPWPAYYEGGTGVVVTAAASATLFSVDGTSSVQPQIGQTIAFYDRANGAFRRKKILSFTGSGPWAITCDASNGASDVNYVPLAGQRVMPWSDSLQDLVTPTLDHFATLGPGEQQSVFPDAGRRQRRQPASPAAWPSTFGNRLVSPVQALASVADAVLATPASPYTTSLAVPTVEPTVPYATPTGTPGVLLYLIELGYISAFPEV